MKVLVIGAVDIGIHVRDTWLVAQTSTVLKEYFS